MFGNKVNPNINPNQKELIKEEISAHLMVMDGLILAKKRDKVAVELGHGAYKHIMELLKEL